jgi:hypothetical protein
MPSSLLHQSVLPPPPSFPDPRLRVGITMPVMMMKNIGSQLGKCRTTEQLINISRSQK